MMACICAVGSLCIYFFYDNRKNVSITLKANEEESIGMLQNALFES